MINYYLDVALCGLVVLAELVGAIGTMLLVQLIFYKIFKINLYKNFWKFLNKMDKKLTEMFR